MLEDEKPLYIKIKIQIRNAIIRGEYPMGSRLPSVRELSAEFGCSLITTKRVYRDLSREGYILTTQGMGTYVHADEQKIAKDKERLVTEAIVQAVEFGNRLNYSADQLQVIFLNALSRLP
ncbi:GntR family transcriptional regulator [Paenibacillus sp. NPDC056933]|uniref:GntR family transcriptional regulator n=1 Tax=Paenibacillus sp. NPDC056933 TaxID=3345968 RepID=UPI0036455CFF